MDGSNQKPIDYSQTPADDPSPSLPASVPENLTRGHHSPIRHLSPPASPSRPLGTPPLACSSESSEPEFEFAVRDTWLRLKVETQLCDGDYAVHVHGNEFVETYLDYQGLLHEKQRLTRKQHIEQGRQHLIKRADQYTNRDFKKIMQSIYGEFDTSHNNANYEKFYEGFTGSKTEQLKSWEKEEDTLLLKNSGIELGLHNLDLYDKEMKDAVLEEEDVPLNPQWAEDMEDYTSVRLQKVNTRLACMVEKFGGNIDRCSLNPALNAGIEWLLLPGFRLRETGNSRLEFIMRGRKEVAEKFKDSPYWKTNAPQLLTKYMLFPALYFSAATEHDLRHILWHQIKVLLAVHKRIMKISEIERKYKGLYGYEITDLVADWKQKFPTLYEGPEQFTAERISFRGHGFGIYDRTVDYDPDTDMYTKEKYIVWKPRDGRPTEKIMEIMEDKADRRRMARARSPPEEAPPSDPEKLKESIFQAYKAQEMMKTIIAMYGHEIPQIPRLYIQPGEEPMKAVSDFIHEHSYARGIVFDLVDPCKVFVLLNQFWDEMELHQREIQRIMLSILTDYDGQRNSFMNEYFLIPGLFVMVFCNCGATEWFRARIVSVASVRPLEVKVQLVDFGSFIIINNLKHIKYMRIDIFREFQQQAVECKLHFEDEICKDDCYPTFHPDFDFKILVLDNPMGIYFRERLHVPNMNSENEWKNEVVWSVTMNLLVKGHKSDHTNKQEFTDMYNPYLDAEIGQELNRRFKRRRRYWPGGRPMNPAEVQDEYELHLQGIHDHGEFLCKVDIYNLSDAVKQFILNPGMASNIPKAKKKKCQGVLVGEHTRVRLKSKTPKAKASRTTGTIPEGFYSESGDESSEFSISDSESDIQSPTETRSGEKDAPDDTKSGAIFKVPPEQASSSSQRADKNRPRFAPETPKAEPKTKTKTKKAKPCADDSTTDDEVLVLEPRPRHKRMTKKKRPNVTDELQ